MYEEAKLLSEDIETAISTRFALIVTLADRREWLLTRAQEEVIKPLAELRRLDARSYKKIVDFIGGKFGADKGDILLALNIAVSIVEKQQEYFGGNEWKKQLQYDETKKKIKSLLTVPLNCLIILENDPECVGKLQFNELTRQVEINSQPPWDDATNLYAKVKPLDDNDVTRIMNWLQEKYRLKLGTSDIIKQVAIVARRLCVHPLKDFLNGSERKWIDEGKVAILGRAISEGFSGVVSQLGGPDNRDLVPIGFKNWMIGSVARVFEPGCKHDVMLILVGPQGGKKSTVFSVLAGEWFTERPPSFNKTGDYVRHMGGKWICEMPEMEHFGKARQAQYKNALSVTVWRDTAKYANFARDTPAAWSCCGTVNVSEAKQLKGVENRRQFFIRLDKIDIEWFKANLELLWGETVYRYHQKERWWFDEAWMDELQNDVNLEYVEDLPNEDLIEEYVSGLESPIPSRFLEALIKSEVQFNKSLGGPSNVARKASAKEMSSVRTIMEKLHWRKLAYSVVIDGKKGQGYERTDKAVLDEQGNRTRSVQKFLTDRFMDDNPGLVG